MPKKDECDTCFAWTVLPEPKKTETMKEEYSKHVTEKLLSYESKEDLK